MSPTPKARKVTEAVFELQGPIDPTLTPPPSRRTGVVVVSSVFGLAVAVLAAVAVAKPELFVTAVQAFVGGF